MSVADRLAEAMEKGVKEVREKLKGVAVHIEEKAPDLARGMAMLTTATIVTAVPVLALATAFPTIAVVAPALVALLTFLIQIGLSVMILALTIGVVRRII